MRKPIDPVNPMPGLSIKKAMASSKPMRNTELVQRQKATIFVFIEPQDAERGSNPEWATRGFETFL